MKWFIKKKFKTPAGQTFVEVKCPRCGYCETVRVYHRHTRCYICETELEDNFQEVNNDK